MVLLGRILSIMRCWSSRGSIVLMAASQLLLEILLGWLFDSLEVLLDRLEWDCLARLGSSSLRDDRLGD